VEIEHQPAIDYVIDRVFDTFKNAPPTKDAAEKSIAAGREPQAMRRRSKRPIV
jgi:hypothetical protein